MAGIRNQRLMSSRCPVDAPRTLVDESDTLEEIGILPSPLRGRTCPPCVVATLGDAENTAHHRGRMRRMVRFHESERRLDVPPAS